MQMTPGNTNKYDKKTPKSTKNKNKIDKNMVGGFGDADGSSKNNKHI